MTDQDTGSLPFQCQHCQRRFKRLEHVQRHERTHTKEAPYRCFCGRSFPRGDLLRRHEKTAHNIDAPRRKRAHSLTEINDPDVIRKAAKTGSEEIQACVRCHYNPFNDASITLNHSHDFNHEQHRGTIVSNGSTNSARLPELRASYQQPTVENRRESLQHTIQDTATQPAGHAAIPDPPDQMLPFFDHPNLDPFDLFGDGDNIFENVDFSSLFLPQGFGLDGELQVGNASDAQDRLEVNGFRQYQQIRDLPPNESNADQNSISRFGSPLPTVRPNKRNDTKLGFGRAEILAKAPPCWKVSTPEYNDLKVKVSALAPILPRDFVLPSKHTFSRYLEGCIKGLLEHMPLLHVPTWSVSSSSAELLLAMAAIGAQFRFEKAYVRLFYAAKSAIMNQVRAIKDDRLVGVLSQAPSLYAGSNETSPHSSRDARINFTQSTPYEGDVNFYRRERLQTMQAIECLMVLGSWGPRELVGEAIAFQSLLAELVREDGLSEENDSELESGGGEEDSSWRHWIRAESLRRTKLMAYTFINLQSVAYNVSPCMLTSEIRFNTPASQDEWKANTAEAWNKARRASKIPTTSFAEAFRSLFQNGEPGSTTPVPPSSAIGNYALIFGILQTIFFLREGSATIPIPNRQDTRNLRHDDIDSLSQALQNWQSRWENSLESSNDPQSSAGPVAFNSTALLRLAWIRLYSDLGPCRNLATRNPALIVEAFKSCPPLHRQASLTPALLHAAHALSVPVRLGISYVAKTQTLSWSVQHSMANLEGCIFLSKWFEAVASTLATTPLTSQEKGIIHLIRSIVLESGFFRDEAFAPPADEHGWQRLIQHIGTAVASLWAEVFSGTHVFEMVSTIGTSLNIYAKLLEDAHTPIMFV